VENSEEGVWGSNFEKRKRSKDGSACRSRFLSEVRGARGSGNNRGERVLFVRTSVLLDGACHGEHKVPYSDPIMAEERRRMGGCNGATNLEGKVITTFCYVGGGCKES